MEIAITDSIIITMDASNSIIESGSVIIDGNRIVEVGKSEDLRNEMKSAEVKISGRKLVLIPGLVNCHVHLAQAMLRGTGNELSLMPWLKDRILPLQGSYEGEDGQVSAQLAILEMLKSGTTTFVESMIAGRYGFENIAQEVDRSGIRACLSKIVMDTQGYAADDSLIHPGMLEDKDACFQEIERMHKKWHGKHERIFVWFGPRTPGAVTPETYREISEKAKKLNTGITLHLGEIRDDVSYTKDNYGMLPFEFAKHCGLLGEKTILAHAVWASPSEIKMLAETGTHIAHNPRSNSKLGSGIAPIAEMLQAGVNVCLGTDGGPSNDTYDLVREMNWASLLQKARTEDASAVPAQESLRMATIGGAKAVGLDDKIGSIEVGKLADIVVFDFSEPGLIPSHDPISTLVYCATGHNVKDVIVDGKLIVQDRNVLTMDEEGITKSVEKRFPEVLKRAGISLYDKSS